MSWTIQLFFQKSLSWSNFPCILYNFLFHVSSHDLWKGSCCSCLQNLFCMSGVHVRAFVSTWFLLGLPRCNCGVFALFFRLQICVFAWVLSQAWSHTSYSIQQPSCKMLIWKSECSIYVRVNKLLKGYSVFLWVLRHGTLWHFLRLHMVIVFAVVCTLNPVFICCCLLCLSAPSCKAGAQAGQRP